MLLQPYFIICDKEIRRLGQTVNPCSLISALIIYGCMFGFFTSQLTFFQSCPDGSCWVEPLLSAESSGVLLEDNAVPLVGLAYKRVYLNLLHEKFYSKPCLKRPLKKKTNIGFRDRLSHNAVRKYCRMLGAFFNTFDLH